MVPRTTPQGAKPAVGSRPAGMTSALRAVPRAEPGKQPSAVTQVPRSQSTPAPAVRPAAPALPPVPEILQEITITEGVTVKELSEKMDRKAKDIITRLIGRGILATINQPLDTKIAKEICREFGFDAKVISFEEEVTLEHTKELDKTHLQSWGTWTTARPRFWTRSASRTSLRAKPAVSRSTSARITSGPGTAASPSSTRPATRPSP